MGVYARVTFPVHTARKTHTNSQRNKLAFVCVWVCGCVTVTLRVCVCLRAVCKENSRGNRVLRCSVLHVLGVCEQQQQSGHTGSTLTPSIVRVFEVVSHTQTLIHKGPSTTRMSRPLTLRYPVQHKHSPIDSTLME